MSLPIWSEFFISQDISNKYEFPEQKVDSQEDDIEAIDFTLDESYAILETEWLMTEH